MKSLRFILGFFFLLLAPAHMVYAASPTLPSYLSSPFSNQHVATTIQILLALTVLSLAPSILILMTAFTRIVVVLSLLRGAIGAQNVPPNAVIIGLSLFLTAFVMQPTFVQIDQKAVVPFMNHTISINRAYGQATSPLRAFMLKETSSHDLSLMEKLSHQVKLSLTKPPFYALVPAFVLTQLRLAFEMGFMIYLPFMIIDLIVASTLMAMGMMMVPPVTISLPIKLLLFVLVNGWDLVIQSLVQSFH